MVYGGHTKMLDSMFAFKKCVVNNAICQPVARQTNKRKDRDVDGISQSTLLYHTLACRATRRGTIGPLGATMYYQYKSCL